MSRVFVSEARTTVYELLERTRQADRPLYIGLSGRPEAFIWPIKHDLQPDQRAAVQASRGLLDKLRAFEKKYRMDSAEFFYRFENALIKESPEYVSWWVSYSAFAGMLQRYNLTRSDVECLLMEDFVTTTGDSKPS
jgi:hypothetical protein